MPNSLRVSSSRGLLPDRTIQLRKSGGWMTSIRMYPARSAVPFNFKRASFTYKTRFDRIQLAGSLTMTSWPKKMNNESMMNWNYLCAVDIIAASFTLGFQHKTFGIFDSHFSSTISFFVLNNDSTCYYDYFSLIINLNELIKRIFHRSFFLMIYFY